MQLVLAKGQLLVFKLILFFVFQLSVLCLIGESKKILSQKMLSYMLQMYTYVL